MGFDREKFLASNARFKEERKNFENLPDGVYNMELDDVDDGVSENSGKERILFTWKVMPGDSDAGRKHFQTFMHTESGYFSLQIALSQLGVKDNLEDLMMNDDERAKIFKKIIGSQARCKIETNTGTNGVDYRNTRIQRVFTKKIDDADIYKDKVPFEVKTQTQPQTQQQVNPMATENEKIYLPECDVICKLPNGTEALGTIKMYNKHTNACFVVFKESGIQPQTIPVPNILKVGKPGELVSNNGSANSTTAPFEEVEEVVEEEIQLPKLEVGQNVKFKFQDKDMGAGEITLLVPEKEAVKIKQAGKLYTVAVKNVTPIV